MMNGMLPNTVVVAVSDLTERGTNNSHCGVRAWDRVGWWEGKEG
jgi:hypothetical protein